MPERKQASVMFTDVVGFTSVMERSEEEAMAIIGRKMAVVRKVLFSGEGRLVKEMGDGTMSVFQTPSEAVAAAVKIQKSLENDDFKIRIGIHCGSVLFEGGDIFGDTVNVASRLEQKAPGGGIIFSREVLACIPEAVRPETVHLGLTRLKGLGRLLQIHFLGSRTAPRYTTEIKLPERKQWPVVLSVFPLKNTGEPQDEFYAYGITADLLSDLARADSISIVPVTSLLEAMKTEETSEKIAGKFGSSILLKGTVARSGLKMTLSVTLKEVDSDSIIWSDTWVEEIEDLPLIKGKMADSILKALGMDPENYPGITGIEVKSLSVYEKYLQALHLWETKKSRQHIHQTRKLLMEVIRNEPVMIPARVLLGRTYIDTDYYSTGLDILNEAQKIAREQNNQAGLLSTLVSLGVLHWRKGEFAEAGNAYNEAGVLAGKIHNKTEECSILNNTGLIDCDRLLFSEALNKLRKSLSMAEELGSMTGQAHSLCNIGLVYWRSGNGARALEYYEKSLNLVTVMGDRSGEANLLTNMGVIYNDRGELEQAYNTASVSMKLSKDLNDRRAVCRALNNMGSVMLVLGMFHVADKHFIDAISIAQQIGLKNMEELLLTNKAVLTMLTGDSAAAADLFRKSMKIAEEVDDKEGIIENTKYLAEIFLKKREASTAAELIRGALKLSVKHGLPREITELTTDLALALLQNGSPVEDVLEQLRRAQNTIIENRKNLPDIYNRWSDICLRIAAQQDLSSAEAELLRKESKKWHSASKDEILKTSGKIQSDEFKQSYMHNIPLHHLILTSTV